MALPRPVLFAILGVALVLAALLATRALGTDDGGTVTPAPAAQPAPAPKAPKPSPGKADRPDRAPAAEDRPAAATPPEASKPTPDRRPAGSAPAKAPTGAGAPVEGVPVAVSSALEAGKVVTLVFTRTGAADDVATRRSVRELRKSFSGNRRVVIIEDSINSVADYRLVLAGVGVSQSPSILVLRKDRQPRLLEGYIDEGSLRQHVADALR